MRLQRVQIPNFRVLKDIDITFEPHRIPQIFPLASQNGGGKSTFLQLVYTLLTCLGDSSKVGLVESILENSGIESFVDNSKLAIISLTDYEVDIRLDFDFYNNHSLLNQTSRYSYEGFQEYGIDGYRLEIASLKATIQRRQDERSDLLSDQRHLLRIWKVSSEDLKPLSMQQLTMLSESGMKFIAVAQTSAATGPREVLEMLAVDIDKRSEDLADLEFQLQMFVNTLKELENELESQGMKVLYSQDGLNLICKISSLNKVETPVDLFRRVADSVFIAAPSSQAFLFLTSIELSTLFSEVNDYYEILRRKQEVVGNLFLYEFSMVQVLTDAFKKAFDNDRAQAIRTGGKYGNEFEALLKDLRDFLENKTIQPSEDMSRITIKQQDKNNQEIELSPADLSHGELRRLSFYAWLKTSRIRNSIVLIDEIEIGMHPDWQYQIVQNLEKWEPSNQYILATHSYEVCSALSPSHVKEIEPKLLKSEAQTAQ
jgi:predicted ATPase